MMNKGLGWGLTFEEELNSHFSSIQINPFFQIRYDDVHCLPLKKHPYMVHFTINEADKKVTIRAVFHTAQDPEKWRHRKLE